MNERTHEWLLSGPAWMRYAVKKQLLGQNADSQEALQDPAIVKLRQRLQDAQLGLPALKNGQLSAEANGNAYWDMYFLADIGLTAHDLHINADLEAVLAKISSDGSLSLDPGMHPDYYCLSAIPVAVIAKLGYQNDARVLRYVNKLFNSMTNGGWRCSEPNYDRKSCPMADLNALMLLSEYDQYQADPRLDGAIDLLLNHWDSRGERLQIDGFGVGSRFQALEYPAIKYGILRVLDVLSCFPHALESPSFDSMLQIVQQKSVDGKYVPETVHPAYAGFDFGQTKEPSRWLTFLMLRVAKHINEI